MENNTVPKQSEQEGKKKTITMPKPNNMFNVDCASSIAFFKWWCIFLRPFISLTDKETDVIASLLKQRWELSKDTKDPAHLDILMKSDKVKQDVIEECGITAQHFYVIKSALKRKGVLKDDIIHPQLIPNVRQDDNGIFRLLIQFKGEV